MCMSCLIWALMQYSYNNTFFTGFLFHHSKCCFCLFFIIAVLFSSVSAMFTSQFIVLLPLNFFRCQVLRKTMADHYCHILHHLDSSFNNFPGCGLVKNPPTLIGHIVCSNIICLSKFSE